jgi:hypothetical protein
VPPPGLEPTIHPRRQRFRLLGIKRKGLPETLKLRPQVREFERGARQTVRQGSAGGVDRLQRPRFPHQGSHPSGDTLFTRQRRQKRSRETSELLRTIHALEVTLEGLDRFGGQVEEIEACELVLQERKLIRGRPPLSPDALGIPEQPTPALVMPLIALPSVSRATEEIEEFQLAPLAQQPPRLAWPMKIDPHLTEAM